MYAPHHIIQHQVKILYRNNEKKKKKKKNYLSPTYA